MGKQMRARMHGAGRGRKHWKWCWGGGRGVVGKRWDLTTDLSSGMYHHNEFEGLFQDFGPGTGQKVYKDTLPGARSWELSRIYGASAGRLPGTKTSKGLHISRRTAPGNSFSRHTAPENRCLGYVSGKICVLKVLDNTGQTVEVREDEDSLELICAA